MLTLRNLSGDRILGRRIALANNPWTRGIGLIGRAKIDPDEGLWIARCNAVHTIGMRAELDLFFLDEAGNVLKVVHSAQRHRLVFACSEASTVVELGAAGWHRGVLLGDRLVLE